MLEAHARHELSQQRYTPAKRYRDLLPIVYKRLAEEWGVHATHEECVAYGQSIANWPAFEDLSRRAQLPQETFQARHPFQRRQRVVRGEQRQAAGRVRRDLHCGRYRFLKPAARNFEYMLEKLEGIGIRKERILHTAESLFHDHKPANDSGLMSCWIFRGATPAGLWPTSDPGATPHVDFKFNSLRELAEAHHCSSCGTNDWDPRRVRQATSIRNPSTSLTMGSPFQRSMSCKTTRRLMSPPSSSFILSIILS